MSATHELEQGRKYASLARDIAELERGARRRANALDKDREPNRGLFACVATELAMARAHVERAAKLLGLDTGAYPRVAHDGKKSAHNERTYTDADGTVRVFYHNTEIVTVRPNGSARLRTGGWLTVSTMKHIRDAMRRHGIPGNVSRAGGVFSYFDNTGDGLRVAANDGRTILLLPDRCECGAPWHEETKGYRCAR